MMTEIREFDAIRKLQRRDPGEAWEFPLSTAAGAYNISTKAESIGRDTPFSDYLEWHGRVMKMVLQGDDLQPVLDDIAQMVERCVASASCSILLLNEAGDRFSRVAAPSFALAFHRALLRLTVEPESGTCGAAVSRRTPVFTADIAGSPLWKSFQELASAHDLASCFSWPIFGQSGRILGTIALYFQDVRAPGDIELRIMPSIADLAAVAIVRQESAGSVTCPITMR